MPKSPRAKIESKKFAESSYTVEKNDFRTASQQPKKTGMIRRQGL